MTPARPPLPPTFLLAVTAGLIGTAMFALGVLVALGMLEAPAPLFEETLVQVLLIGVGLVLMALEVRAVLAFARGRRPPPAP